MSEIDHELFARTAPFCAYVHLRPDGTPFYVGKGVRRRAFDFAPSRRTKYHQNIVAKYGRGAIIVKVIPAMDEVEALELEKALIAGYRADGDSLANLTDGGEGCSGRAATEAQLAALAKGRGPVRERVSPEAFERILAGLARGREKSKAWRASAAGREHIRRLSTSPLSHRAAPHDLACDWCGKVFTTQSGKKNICCSKLCQQRKRRHRQKWGL